MTEAAAYVIGHVTIRDADKWAEYRSKVPATLVPWNAEVVLRGKRSEVLGGEHRYTDVVVLRFPSPDAVSGWFHSPSYQALLPLREQAAEMALVSYRSEPG